MIIGEAATRKGLTLKQAEVHGMSQRGGDVQSNLRLSEGPIASDLIPLGQADMILSLEPLEALRYLPYLAKDGWIITSSAPFKNIPNYPDEADLFAELNAQPHVVALDVETLAKENNVAKSANVVLLGQRGAAGCGCRVPEDFGRRNAAQERGSHFCGKGCRRNRSEQPCIRHRA